MNNIYRDSHATLKDQHTNVLSKQHIQKRLAEYYHEPKHKPELPDFIQEGNRQRIHYVTVQDIVAMFDGEIEYDNQ